MMQAYNYPSAAGHHPDELNDDDHDHVQATTTATTEVKLPASKRKRGSGMMVLRQELETAAADDDDESRSSSNLLSSRQSKSILRNLLRENEVELPNENDESITAITKKKKRKPIDSSMSDERVMQLAQEGELSFLASILKVMEEEGDGRSVLTTKFMIKACCLACEPARVPAWCDAKEMVMAALYLLSRELPPEPTATTTTAASTLASVFPPLPLVRPVQETPDLEKRSYERVGNWSIVHDATLLEQVLALERVFYDGLQNGPNKWLAREHACPHLPSGRDLLLLKGSPPAFCTGKKSKGGGTGGGGGTASSASSAGAPRGRKLGSTKAALAAAAAAAAAAASAASAATLSATGSNVSDADRL